MNDESFMLDLETLIGTLARALISGTGLIPKNWGDKLGSIMGNLLFALDGKHRSIALTNLQRALGSELPGAQLRSIARQVFKNLGRMPFEIAWSGRLAPHTFSRHFKISGRENYYRAVAKGKGVLLLTAHMGNWELFPIIASMARIKANVVYRPLDSAPLDDVVKEHRCRFGANLIPTTNRRTIVQILNTLKNNECVVMLMDQNVDYYNGVFVDFFGRSACTNKGMAILARRSGAPVVPIFMVREAGGFRAEVLPEISLTRTGDKQKDIEANTAKFNQAIEGFVRQYPDQWFWVHQRWKTRPYSNWPREI